MRHSLLVLSLFIAVALTVGKEDDLKIANCDKPDCLNPCLHCPTLFRVKKAVGTVKCYQCNSDNVGEKECATSDDDALKKFIKPCPKLTEGSFAGTEANSCRKILQNVVENSTIVRECAYTGNEPLHGKRRTGNKGVSLYLYQCFNEDNDKPCNSAISLFGSHFIISFITSLFSVFYCLKFVL